MAKPHIIKCSDCGWPRLTRWKNTKYCFHCRLIRNLDFVGEKTQKCLVCDKEFAPLKRGDELCGDCDTLPLFEDCTGTCSFCKEPDKPYIAPEVKVCKGCGKKPENRNKLKKALLIKRQKILKGEIEKPILEVPASKSKEWTPPPTI